MADDITCRLNVNSVAQVYSASLPAIILYVTFHLFSIVLLHKFSHVSTVFIIELLYTLRVIVLKTALVLAHQSGKIETHHQPR